MILKENLFEAVDTIGRNRPDSYKKREPKKKKLSYEVYDTLDDLGYKVYASRDAYGFEISKKIEKNLDKAKEALDKLGVKYKVKPFGGRYYLTALIDQEEDEQDSVRPRRHDKSLDEDLNQKKIYFTRKPFDIEEIKDDASKEYDEEELEGYTIVDTYSTGPITIISELDSIIEETDFLGGSEQGIRQVIAIDDKTGTYLVDPQGYDYARYVAYIPKKEYIKEDIVKSIEPLDSEVAREIDFVFASDDQNFGYKMLDRLKSDCLYILKALKDYSPDGKLSLETINKFLWFHDIDKQIAFMKGIYDRLDEEPEWISKEQIEEYGNKLKDLIRVELKERFEKVKLVSEDLNNEQYWVSIEPNSNHSEYMQSKDFQNDKKIIDTITSQTNMKMVPSWFKVFYIGSKENAEAFAQKCCEQLDDYFWIVSDAKPLDDKLKKQLKVEESFNDENIIRERTIEELEELISDYKKEVQKYIAINDLEEAKWYQDQIIWAENELRRKESENKKLFTIEAVDTGKDKEGNQISAVHSYKIIIEADNEDEAKEIYFSYADPKRFEIKNITSTTDEEKKDNKIYIISKTQSIKEGLLKEDLDPKTNNTDDLYALWYPYVGKRIVDKNTMIRALQEEIQRIKRGTAWNVGEGFAFRCIQAIDNGEPLVPSHDKSDDEWFKRLRYDEKKESLKEDLNQETLDESALVTLVNDLINDENEAINSYESAIVSFNKITNDYEPVFKDIINEEQNHIGQLQKILDDIKPGTINELEKGQDEATEQIVDQENN